MKKRMITIRNVIGILMLSMVFFTCKKAETLETLSTPKNTVAATQTYYPAHPYDMDIVYFVPNGSTPVTQYQQRLQLLQVQTTAFFSNQMRLYGFGAKAPYMDLDPLAAYGDVKIKIVNGKYPISNYVGGEVGLQAASDEVDAYFKENNIRAKSEYKLIIIPGVGPNKFTEKDPFVPCSSPERRAFLVDYSDFYATPTNMDQNPKFQLAFGTFLHEMGHAFGLQHRTLNLGELIGKTLLMSNPTPSYWYNLELMYEDCKILDFNQVFNSTTDKSFATISGFRITSIKLVRESSAANSPFIMSGDYAMNPGANLGVAALIAYDDPNQTCEWKRNTDYDALVPYYNNESGNLEHRFSFKIYSPISSRAPFHRVTLCFVLTNGLIVKRNYLYYAYGTDDETSVHSASELVSDEIGDIDRSKWEVKSTSGQYIYGNSGYVSTLLDNDRNTRWFMPLTSNGTVFPHEVVIDCKETITAARFWMSERTFLNFSKGLNFELQVSNDGVNFRSVGRFTSHGNTNGGASKAPAREYFALASLQTFRYFKYVMVSPVDKQSEKASLVSELGFNEYYASQRR